MKIFYLKLLSYIILIPLISFKISLCEIILTSNSNNGYKRFGRSVSISEKYAIVGTDYNEAKYSSVYIYEIYGLKWSLEKEFRTYANDGLGSGVAISNNYAIIGACYEDQNSTKNSGVVYMLSRNENSWDLQCKINAPDMTANAVFGRSVSICNNQIIVGAPGDGGLKSYNSAYIFVANNDNWILQEKLTASDLNDDSYFGNKVSIFNNYAIVSARNSVYFYFYDGNNWLEHSKFSFDRIYSMPSVSITNNYAIVGFSNHAYIYELKNDIWTNVCTFSIASTSVYPGFVSIFNEYAAIGERLASYKGTHSGAVCIYQRIKDSWQRQAIITASDTNEHDNFGSYVSITNNNVIVGVPSKDDCVAYIYPTNIQNPIISGHVTGLNEVPLSGATISFDKLSPSIITNEKGYFEKDVIYNWSGRATVSFENYIFKPCYIEFSTVTNNIQNQNFKVPTSTITGFVKDNLKNPFNNATIQFENWKTVNTDENGFYQIDIFNEWLGNANIFYKNYIFDPPNISFNSIAQDLTNQNFSISVFTISGFVKDLTGNPISGIEIDFSDEGGKTFTNSQGYYCHNVYHNWSGTVTVQGKGFKYSPQGILYNNVFQHYPNQHFIGSKNSVSGYCLNSLNKPIEDVEILMLPDQITTLTDKYGFYSFDIDYLWSGTLKSTKPGYSFEPEAKEYQSIENNTGNQNFIGEIKTYSVTGTIFDQTNSPIDNVQLYTNEENQNSVQTDSNGIYEIIVHSDWTGIITPQKQGYIFNPTFRSYDNISKNHILQHFTGEYNEVNNSLDWSVNVSQFIYQSMITAIVKDQDNNLLQSDKDKLAAFVDGKCRGMITPSPVADGKRFFLQVWSDQNSEQMTIKYYDSKKNIVYTHVFPDIEFVPNLELGMISDPYVFTVQKGQHIPDANDDGEVNLIDVIDVLQFITDFK